MSHAPSPREYANIKVTLVKTSDTGKAILVDRDDLFDQVWLPLAALDSAGRVAVSRAAPRDQIEIGLEADLAMEKGLVE